LYKIKKNLSGNTVEECCDASSLNLTLGVLHCDCYNIICKLNEHDYERYIELMSEFDT